MIEEICEGGNVKIIATSGKITGNFINWKDVSIFVKKSNGFEELEKISFHLSQKDVLVKEAYLNSKRVFVKTGYAFYPNEDVTLTFNEYGISLSWNAEDGSRKTKSLNNLINFDIECEDAVA